MQLNFKGFSKPALQFLMEIRIHNSKVWYEAHKQVYRDCLLAPFQALVGDLSDFMLSIDPQFITTPAVDKTISRIYRDTRFSRDKSLYRDSMWLTFKKPSEDWKEAPAFFFEITPAAYRHGMGFYSAPKAFMDRFRTQLAAKPGLFLETVSGLTASGRFSLEGEKYKRILNPGLPAPIQEWCQFKSFYLTSNHEIDDLLFSQRLVTTLISDFSLLAPLYHYLWEIKNSL